MDKKQDQSICFLQYIQFRFKDIIGLKENYRNIYQTNIVFILILLILLSDKIFYDKIVTRDK